MDEVLTQTKIMLGLKNTIELLCLFSQYWSHSFFPTIIYKSHNFNVADLHCQFVKVHNNNNFHHFVYDLRLIVW